MTKIKNSTLLKVPVKIFYQKSHLCDLISRIDDSHVSVAFLPGYSWEEIYFSIDSVDFTEKPSLSNAGPLVSQKLSFTHPGEDEDDIEFFESLFGTGLLFKLEFSDGSLKLLGSKENPVFIEIDYKSGDSNTGITVIADHRNDQRAPWITE
jgi:hypothetical protein